MCQKASEEEDHGRCNPDDDVEDTQNGIEGLRVSKRFRILNQREEEEHEDQRLRELVDYQGARHDKTRPPVVRFQAEPEVGISFVKSFET